MAKFFYSKTDDTNNASQAENAIILNFPSTSVGRKVKFYKNGSQIRNLSIPNNDGGNIGATVSNIGSRMQNNSVFQSFFYDTQSPQGSIIPPNPGTNGTVSAFAYMKANNSNWPR